MGRASVTRVAIVVVLAAARVVVARSPARTAVRHHLLGRAARRFRRSCPPAPARASRKTPRTRVVLIDGLAAELTPSLPVWTATCKRGLSCESTSVPDGIVARGGRAVERPDPAADRDRTIAAGGAAATRPPARSTARSPRHPRANSRLGRGRRGSRLRSCGRSASRARCLLRARDAGRRRQRRDLARWLERQLGVRRALRGREHGAAGVRPHPARRHGGASLRRGRTLRTSRRLRRRDPGPVAGRHPTARWFLLTDHGHIGSHGGEERAVRHVEACIAGPGVARQDAGRWCTSSTSRVRSPIRPVRSSNPASMGRPLSRLRWRRRSRRIRRCRRLSCRAACSRYSCSPPGSA